MLSWRSNKIHCSRFQNHLQELLQHLIDMIFFSSLPYQPTSPIRPFVLSISDSSVIVNVNTTLLMLHLGQVTSCKPYFPNMHTILCTLCVTSTPSYYSVQLNHLSMFSVAPTFFLLVNFFCFHPFSCFQDSCYQLASLKTR